MPCEFKIEISDRGSDKSQFKGLLETVSMQVHYVNPRKHPLIFNCAMMFDPEWEIYINRWHISNMTIIQC
jgi:hypothetical protein